MIFTPIFTPDLTRIHSTGAPYHLPYITRYGLTIGPTSLFQYPAVTIVKRTCGGQLTWTHMLRHWSRNTDGCKVFEIMFINLKLIVSVGNLLSPLMQCTFDRQCNSGCKNNNNKNNNVSFQG